MKFGRGRQGLDQVVAMQVHMEMVGNGHPQFPTQAPIVNFTLKGKLGME